MKINTEGLKRTLQTWNWTQSLIQIVTNINFDYRKHENFDLKPEKKGNIDSEVYNCIFF